MLPLVTRVTGQEPFSVQCAHGGQHFGRMALRADRREHAGDATASIHDEGHSSRVATGRFDTERRGESTCRVGDQRERESVLRRERPVRREIIGAHADERDPRFVRERAFVTERFDFADSTRCTVSGIEEHDEDVSTRTGGHVDHASVVRDSVKCRDGIAHTEQRSACRRRDTQVRAGTARGRRRSAGQRRVRGPAGED